MGEGDTESVKHTVKRKAPRTAWKPGQSGNPNGRPKKGWCWADLIEDEINTQLVSREGMTLEAKKAIVKRLVKMAVEGDLPAIRELFDRTEGKARQGIDISSEGRGIKLDVSAMLRKVYGQPGYDSSKELPGNS